MNKLKIIMQHDAMQCGIASLAMICNYYGRNTSIEDLSKICFASSEGVSLQGLCDAATIIGLNSIPGKVTIDSLCNENLPCILHWNQNHFVVLYKVKGNKFFIADPSKGVRKYTLEQIHKHWIGTTSNGQDKGIALFLEPTESFKKTEKRKVPVCNPSITWALSSGILGNYTNAYNMLSPIGYHNIALRYMAPFGLTVGGDYTRYSENRSQSLIKDTDYLFGSNNIQDINSYHIYLDQQHQLGKWQLNYGAEYQRSEDHSSQHYYPTEMPNFDDFLNEDVASFYVGTQRSFDWGLSFNASAKGEYYHSKYQHNWNFLPQIGATYYKNPKSIFQLNLSTQRMYPSYWELHGGTNYINDYSMIIGNHELQPYIQYNAQFNYILKQKYVATLYFQYGDKATVQLPYQAPDVLNLIYQTINMNYKRMVGLNLHAPFSVGYVWDATATANVFNQREKADKFHDISFDNRKWIFYGGLSNSFKFSQNCPVSLSIDFSYISPSLQGIADLSSMRKVDAGVKWQFEKKRCCELDLKADDIFNSWSPTMTINRAGQDYKMKV